MAGPLAPHKAPNRPGLRSGLRNGAPRLPVGCGGRSGDSLIKGWSHFKGWGACGGPSPCLMKECPCLVPVCDRKTPVFNWRAFAPLSTSYTSVVV